MDFLFLKRLSSLIVFVFAGIFLVTYFIRHLAKTEPDSGQFTLSRWKLEPELELNPHPRETRPKDLSVQKKKIHWAMGLLTFLGAGVFFFHMMRARERANSPDLFFPIFFVSVVFIFMLGLKYLMMKKRVVSDVAILAQGVAIGALVIGSYRHKHQRSYRLRFGYEGKLYERAVVDVLQSYHGSSPLEEGEEVTIIFNPINIKKTLRIYRYMLAEVRHSEQYRTS